MPRAIDPSLPAGGLPLDHNPLNTIQYNVIPNPTDLAELLQMIIDGFVNQVRDYIFPAIEQLTGIDLSVFLPLLDVLDLDFSSPAAFLESLTAAIVALPAALTQVLVGVINQLTGPGGTEQLTQLISSFIGLLVTLPTLILDLANALISAGVGLLGINSPLNALNLFNLIPQNILGQIPFNHIGEGIPNLLANPSFEGAESVQGSGIWLWDSIAGRTVAGSVYTTAAGADRQLVSNGIPVSTGQQLNLSAWAKWSGLAYTGTPIKVQVVRLLNYVNVGVDDLASPTAPATNQASWVQIGGDYPVPAGCDMVCLRLAVTSTATAGTVWFDDGDVHKLGNTSTFIPFLNVTGVGGPTNIGASITETWNHIISGFVGVPDTSSGAGIADLWGIGQDVSSWASLGRYSWDILGIRNNKPLDQGLLATSNSNFSLGRVAMNASAPTIAVTQSVSAIGFLRMAESNDKGVVTWLGSGVTNVTDCYVNIWQMDPDTGDMTLVHRSSNISGLLKASMDWVIYDYSAIAPNLTVMGEVYGIEITIRGTGTHTIAGTTTWIPNHPSSFPKTYAATRNSGTGSPTLGTVIPSASVVYSTNIPWIEWGIHVSPAAGTHTPETTQFTAVGSSSIPIPTWANFVDVIAIGGGGGGAAGGFYGIPGGNGGDAGTWATATWARGTDYTGATTISTTVGAAGTGTSSGVLGTNGASSVASITGHTVTAAGGAASGGAGQGGDSAGNQAYGGFTYVGGGAQTTPGGAGAVPGGGGASGSDFSAAAGGPGGRGGIWIVFREV